jgi:hypothetical protein
VSATPWQTGRYPRKQLVYELQAGALSATTGVHDVFLVFESNPGSGFVANLDWFTLR